MFFCWKTWGRQKLSNKPKWKREARCYLLPVNRFQVRTAVHEQHQERGGMKCVDHLIFSAKRLLYLHLSGQCIVTKIAQENRGCEHKKLQNPIKRNTEICIWCRIILCTHTGWEPTVWVAIPPKSALAFLWTQQAEYKPRACLHQKEGKQHTTALEEWSQQAEESYFSPLLNVSSC